MTRLGGYVLRRTLRGLLLAGGVVFALIALVDFVEATRDVDADSVLSGMDLFRLTLLKMPSLLEQTLPFVVLFGVIGTLNGLNRRSELIAARAAGVSAWRYLRPVLALAALFGAVWVLAVNPVAGRLLQEGENIRREDSGVASGVAKGAAEAANSGRVWLREADDSTRTVILAERANAATRTLEDVTHLRFRRADNSRGAGGDTLTRRLDAERATWLPTGHFQLRGVREWVDEDYGPRLEALAIPTSITQRQLLERLDQQRRARRLPPVWGLPALIREQKRAGFSTLGARMALWRLAALPVLLVGMALIGACVSMRLSRGGGTWRLILAGGVVGFAVFFSTVFIEAFGEVGTIPPAIAAWTVPLVTLLVGMATLAQLEDG